MAGTLMPWVKSQWFTTAGAPAAGYQLFTYTAGTSTKLATYSDSALTVANTNPIILDAAGRALVFLTPSTYKFVLAPPEDTDPPTSPEWTVDDVQAIPLIDQAVDYIGTAGEALVAGEVAYLSDGSGSKTAGKWYLGDASNAYSSTEAGTVAFVVNGADVDAEATLRRLGRVTDLTGLNTGSIYYISSTPGSITLTAPTNAKPVAVADSATSVVIEIAPALTQDLILYNESALDLETQGTSEEILKAVTILANSFGTNGAYSGFELDASLHAAANTNNKTLSVRIGGIAGVVVNTFAADATSGNQFQFHSLFQVVDATTVNGRGSSTRITGASTIFGSPALGSLDFTDPIDVVVTAETGTAAGDIILDSLRVVLLRKQA